MGVAGKDRQANVPVSSLSLQGLGVLGFSVAGLRDLGFGVYGF